MDSIRLTSTDRQLLLYDIFYGCREVSFAEVTSRLPVGKKMLQRDIRTLTDAGLIRVAYSRKEKAYLHCAEKPEFDESAKGKRRAHLLKLRRIATLMTELYTESDSYYENDGDDYFSCKKCYYELFPDAGEKMRQRDFEQLNRIGYTLYYDNTFRRYRMWDGYVMREDFGVYLENGRLMRCTASVYNM